jgi:gliding motility-associated-like protein
MMYDSFPLFTMPNAISPNDEGYNDLFRTVTIPEKESSFTMNINNKWGQLVVAIKDLGTGWDKLPSTSSLRQAPFDKLPSTSSLRQAQGLQLQGVELQAPMGLYTYIISCSNITGETRQKTGTVILIR